METNITITINGEEVKDLNPDVIDTEGMELEVSEHARLFDEKSPYWSRDSKYNIYYLRQQQMYANVLLKDRGYLFLNDVYDMLGLPRSKAGQLYGWLYSEENTVSDNYIDFGLLNPYNEDFINGEKESALLDFNVACIFDKI